VITQGNIYEQIFIFMLYGPSLISTFEVLGISVVSSALPTVRYQPPPRPPPPLEEPPPKEPPLREDPPELDDGGFGRAAAKDASLENEAVESRDGSRVQEST
jgi:hypothetical protein